MWYFVGYLLQIMRDFHYFIDFIQFITEFITVFITVVKIINYFDLF